MVAIHMKDRELKGFGDVRTMSRRSSNMALSRESDLIICD